MISARRLTAVLAHPDDESLGLGGTLAKYAAEGVETSLIMATRGECGWFGDPAAYPGPEALGRLREGELRQAANVLGIRELAFLDEIDGKLDQADPDVAIAKIVGHLRRLRPEVVVTFGPDGAYGHPDHIAISQLTTTAVMYAADASYDGFSSYAPHRVAKLYYKIWTDTEQAAYEPVFGEGGIDVDGEPRQAVGWREWAVTTRIDTERHWRTVFQAVTCHQTQLLPHVRRCLESLDADQHAALWGPQSFYRVMSTVSGGRGRETDLFAGVG